uniref:Small ribosomal subunit protein mS26 n=1 Tax=Cacopsylla melanoneura TaxID=428564 RepID=A0A8D9AYY5_9HEMI
MSRELLKVFIRGSELSASSLPFTHISVRYRKPIWLPTAPSKKFKIPPRTVLPDNEKRELDRLTKNYKTYNKAILAYHGEINARQSVTDPGVIEAQRRAVEEDWEHSNNLNAEWNAEVAAEREQRLAIEKEEKVIQIVAEKEAKKQKESEDLERAEQAVQAEIENSKTFITRDNIDQYIEQALSSHIDYNFAIDKEGNVYQGKKANPRNSKEVLAEDQQEAAAKN